MAKYNILIISYMRGFGIYSKYIATVSHKGGLGKALTKYWYYCCHYFGCTRMHLNLSVLCHPKFPNTLIKDNYIKTIIISYVFKDWTELLHFIYSINMTLIYIDWLLYYYFIIFLLVVVNHSSAWPDTYAGLEVEPSTTDHDNLFLGVDRATWLTGGFEQVYCTNIILMILF